MLISAAESYLGTPYRYGGLDRRGLDCSGLVYLSFKDAFNISIPRTAESLYAWTEKIPAAEMRAGDLVFFITTGPGISHVGIYMGNGRFIHAPSEGSITGVSYSQLDESYWRRTFAGAGRALPWNEDSYFDETLPFKDEGSRHSLARTGQISSGTQRESAQSWKRSTGLFAGLGMGLSFGSFIGESFFRGFALQAKIGYKGLFSPSIQTSLELRPEWDRLLGIYRLPIAFSAGTDVFQIFGGPVLTIGEPEISSQSRKYHQGFNWLGELGISAALPPLELSQGALSLYTEVAWQPYFRNQGEKRNLSADLSANLRFSAGLRYLGLVGN